jgi:hypothetical protein
MLLSINIKIFVTIPADISFNEPPIMHAVHPHHYLQESKLYAALQTQYILILKYQQLHIRSSKERALVLIILPGFANLFINTVFIYCITNGTFTLYYRHINGPGSSVVIANDYGLDGPGIVSRWGRDCSHTSRPVLKPTQPPVQWISGLSRG